MHSNDHTPKLDFSDVLLVPQRSSLDSRKKVIVEREFQFRHTDRTWTGVPIIAANMDTTGTFEMAKALAKHKCMTALHKHYGTEDLASFFIDNLHIQNYIFYTVGAVSKDFEKLEKVKEIIHEKTLKLEKSSHKFTDEYYDFPRFICMDVANGYTEFFVKQLAKLRSIFPNAVIMAGNVCTPNMAEELILKGADIAKVGIGPGSVCTTRVKTGVGYPQLSAIDECSHVVHGLSDPAMENRAGGHVCADGGCTRPADIAKAFAVGGDFVMLGGMLSATDECEGSWEYEYVNPGEPMTVTTEGKKKWFKFHGMSSKEAQEKWSGKKMDSYKASEGKEVKIPYKGSVNDVVLDILGGLRSSCSYVGASRIKDLPKCAAFVRTAVQENRIYS